MITCDPILHTVEDFLSKTGMAPATFGKEALGDPRLVFDLRNGRELRRATRARVEHFIQSSGTEAA